MSLLYAKQHKSDRERQILHDFTHVESKKNTHTDGQTVKRNTFIDKKNRVVVTRREGVWALGEVGEEAQLYADER